MLDLPSLSINLAILCILGNTLIPGLVSNDRIYALLWLSWVACWAVSPFLLLAGHPPARFEPKTSAELWGVAMVVIVHTYAVCWFVL